MDSWQLYISNLLFLLLLLVSQVFCNCDITKKQFNETKAVITMNGKYLRTSHINTNETLDIYPLSGRKTSVRCNDNGTFVPWIPSFKRKPKSEACPLDNDVIVEPISFNSHCQGEMYHIGYRIEGPVLELYRSCYDKVNYVTRFSEALIYPSKNNVQADRPQCGFTRDGFMNPKVGKSISRINVTQTFSLLYNGKYDNEMKSNQIDRGYLIASDDVLTYDQKVATFKMINVIPQFSSIQGTGNWYKIEQYVRSLADEQNNLPCIYVQSGSYDVLKLPDTAGKLVKANLFQGSKFPVPAWMYKLVKNVQNIPLFAIIISNNPFVKRKPARPAICTMVNCPQNLNLNDIAKKGYYYCCDATSFDPHPSQSSTTIQPPTTTQPLCTLN